LLQLLRDYADDGVVLELQNVLPSDRKAFADFVSDLAAQLHGRGRPLSLVVPAKAAPASRPDADAYDLKALGRAADWLILRAYDDQRAAGPVGPLAPLPWVEAAIKNMIARAAGYRLGGTAFWRLGCETPDLWTMASAYLRPQERAVSSTR